MRHLLALYFFCVALAACSATPLRSLDATQNKAPSFTVSGNCSSTELTPEAKNECGTFKLGFSGASTLSVAADGPPTWNAQIAVEIYDATVDDSGPLCPLIFDANGIQECGRFIVGDQDIVGVIVTVTPNVPTGVRLSLLTDSQ